MANLFNALEFNDNAKHMRKVTFHTALERIHCLFGNGSNIITITCEGPEVKISEEHLYVWRVQPDTKVTFMGITTDGRVVKTKSASFIMIDGKRYPILDVTVRRTNGDPDLFSDDRVNLPDSCLLEMMEKRLTAIRSVVPGFLEQ
jgi:hypothetical protein